MRILLALSLMFGGCVNVSMQCPDKVSTVSYRGLSLMGATSVSCVGSSLGGDTAQVSGIDMTALAAAIAPLVLGGVLAEPQPPNKDKDSEVKPQAYNL